MSYVDAGYVIALVALSLYALSLLARRRRLERAAGHPVEGKGGAPPVDGRAPRNRRR